MKQSICQSLLFTCAILAAAASLASSDAPQNKTSEKTVYDRSTKGSAGMGFGGIADWSTQLPFLDLMKQSRNWQDWFNKVEGFHTDENDWLLSLKPGQTAGTVFLAIDDAEALPFDRVFVFYDGDGHVDYSWAARKDVAASSPERDVVNLGTGSHLLVIRETNPKNPVRNIRIIPEPYLEAYKKGEIFNPQWLAYVEKFQAYRFMDWMVTNGSKQQYWKDRPKEQHRTWQGNGGVPLEVMLRLVNKMKVDPWFNIPHMATENYVLEFARKVKELLDPSLYVYIEHSNEVWNWGFPQSQYGIQAAKKRWGEVPEGFMQYHGMRTAQICNVFKGEVFKSDKEKVKCVLGVHTGWRDLQIAAMQCPMWVKEGNKACYKHDIDYLGVTTYFDAGLNGPPFYEDNLKQTQTLRSWFKEKDGGLNLAFEQLESGKHMRSVKHYENYRGVYHETKDKMNYWVGYAKKHGLGIVAYEGGQHISANGLKHYNDQDFIDFHIAINRDPRMEKVYRDFLRAWKEGGGKLHVHFVDVGVPSKHGSWGSLEHLNQKTSPQWRAITDYNENVPCWWEGCKGLNQKSSMPSSSK